MLYWHVFPLWLCSVSLLLIPSWELPVLVIELPQWRQEESKQPLCMWFECSGDLMNRQTYDLNAREMIWWQTKGHTPEKLLNSAMRVGTAVLLTFRFPPTLRARSCLHCSCSCCTEYFGWCASVQPLKGACSRGGFQHRLPPVPPYGLLMCGIAHKPMSSTYIHSWLVILEYVIKYPEFVPLFSSLAGENQSVPWNLTLCMQIIELSCLWSSAKEADLWKKETISV